MNIKNMHKWSLLVAIVILAVAIIRLPTSDIRAGFELSFRCGIVFLFAAFLYDINKWVGFFLLLALFSHSIPFFVMTKFGLIQTKESYLALDQVIAGCGFYTIIVCKCKKLEYLLNTICIIGLVNVLFLTIYQCGGDPYVLIGLSSKVKFVGFNNGIMANPSESGALMALCIPAFFRSDMAMWKVRWCYLLPLVILGIILSVSYNGVVGSAVAVIIFAGIHGYKFWPVTIMASTAILYYKFIHQPSIADRIEMWGKSLGLCIDHFPVTGCGLGNWKIINKGLVETGKWPIGSGGLRLHNSFVQGYVEMGVGFIINVVGYLRDIIRRSSGNFRFELTKLAIPISALGASVTVMISNSVFRMNMINGMIIIIWLAYMEIALRKREEEHEKKLGHVWGKKLKKEANHE